MPGLSSFCMTAAICILFIFLLQTSWTVAWLSLDQARIERGQHGVFPCIILPDQDQAVEEEISRGEKAADFYSDLFKYWPFKVIVLTFAVIPTFTVQVVGSPHIGRSPVSWSLRLS